MLTLFDYRVFDDGFILAVAQNNTDSGIVVFAAFEVVKHAHIHIHLTDVLMAELAGFQVDDDKTLEQIIVENQVNKKVAGLSANTHLPRDEREPLAKFQQKLLQFINNRLLQPALFYLASLRQLQEFQHIRVFDKLQVGRCAPVLAMVGSGLTAGVENSGF